MPPRLVSLRIGLPRHYGHDDATDPFDRPWTSAIAKEAVDIPVRLTFEGFRGDGVADRTVHGGADKAVLAGAVEHLAYWRTWLGRDDVGPGAFGENLVFEGATEDDVCIGDIFGLGGADVQVSQPRQPCWKQARRWRQFGLPRELQRTGYTGWYFRVLKEGLVARDDVLRRYDRPAPEWSVARANAVMHGRPVDVDAIVALSQVEDLADRWKTSLQRLARGEGGDGAARLDGPNRG